MRTRLTVVQVLSLALIVTLGAVWMKSRAIAVDLQARLSALSAFRRNTASALRRERDRLRLALAEAERRRADPFAISSAPAQPAPPRAVAPSVALGEWRSSQEWRNEGQATARGTVGTLLWAAAGGDVAAMIPLIAYDDASRKQARALFDSLSPGARQIFPTPEALVAGLTIQAVSTNAAQLSWFHQRDADHATVGLLLGAPEQTAPAELVVVPAKDNSPPTLANPRSNQLAVLSFERSPSGWQVIIPATAVERLGQQLKASVR